MKYFIISPAVLMTIPWCIVLILYSFHMTENLVLLPLSLIALLVFAICLFSASSIFSYFSILKSERFQKNMVEKIDGNKLMFLIKLQSILWVLGTLFEIFYSKGVPLLWVILGDSRNYTDFGIPSFHGLMNAFYFSLVSCLFLMYKLTGRYGYLFGVVLFGFWPILMLGRGIILTVVVQLVIIQIFYSEIQLKKMMILGLIAIFVVLGFGFIGDVRGLVNPFSHLVASKYELMFDILPSGFLWIYVYITSPLSNLAFNFDSINPVWSLYFSKVNLFPSIFRPEGLERADNFLFVEDSLNVSTIFSSSHSDFGFWGDVGILILLAVWSGYWFRRLKFSDTYILPYSMVGTVMFFSIFYNLFLLYPYIFSTILLGLVAKFVKTN